MRLQSEREETKTILKSVPGYMNAETQAKKRLLAVSEAFACVQTVQTLSTLMTAVIANAALEL